jgi:CDP-glycerol glycerophosphotransferase
MRLESLCPNQLEIKYGGQWIFLVKLHPHLISKSNQLVYGNDVRDVTSYNDIQELLSISDVLISDYSSLMFDFSLTKRPCFLYVPDLIEYTSNDRNLYFDINDLPFIIATSNNQLVNKIENFKYEDYQQKLMLFEEKIGSFENGVASKNLMEKIDKVCFKKKWRNLNEAI